MVGVIVAVAVSIGVNVTVGVTVIVGVFVGGFSISWKDVPEHACSKIANTIAKKNLRIRFLFHAIIL